MTKDQLADRLFGHIEQYKELVHANVLQARREHSRVQARNRSERSNSVDYTPFEEVRNQDYDQVRPPCRRQTQTGDTK